MSYGHVEIDTKVFLLSLVLIAIVIIVIGLWFADTMLRSMNWI